MEIASEQLINDLIRCVNNQKEKVKKMQNIASNALNYKSSNASWSALQCIEHLKLYGDFYIPEIEQRIKQSKHRSRTHFKSGILGNYFANLMKPKPNMKTMKSPKDKLPSQSELPLELLETFIEQLNKTLVLLEEAKNVDLQRTKASISISKLVKLRLGDVFRFLIYHNERHLVQAEKAISNATQG